MNALLKQPVNPIHILTARLNGLEEELRKVQAANEELKKQVFMKSGIEQIENLRELKVCDSLKFIGKKADIVDKRYRVWEVLFKCGFTMSQIARAWSVDHGTIYHAKLNGWRARYMGN